MITAGHHENSNRCVYFGKRPFGQQYIWHWWDIDKGYRIIHRKGVTSLLLAAIAIMLIRKGFTQFGVLLPAY